MDLVAHYNNKGQNEQKSFLNNSSNTEGGSTPLRPTGCSNVNVVMYFSMQQAGNFTILLPREVVEAECKLGQKGIQ